MKEKCFQIFEKIKGKELKETQQKYFWNFFLEEGKEECEDKQR